MLDHCDNVASGGTMDTTAVLAEVLRQGLEDAVFYAIHDPGAAGYPREALDGEQPHAGGLAEGLREGLDAVVRGDVLEVGGERGLMGLCGSCRSVEEQVMRADRLKGPFHTVATGGAAAAPAS